jgi:M6 family metalloprotease-like protein
MRSTPARLSSWVGGVAATALVASFLAIATTSSPAASVGAATAVAKDGKGHHARHNDPTVAPDFVPAAPLTQVLRQPDGTTFSATLSPARVGGLFETAQGYSVERDSDGVWRYVTGRDADGNVELSDAAVGRGAPPAGLAKHAGRQATKVDPLAERMRAGIQQQLRRASYQAQMQAAAAGTPRIFRVPALLLATWWDADKGQTEPQFQAGHDPSYFKKLLDGFGGNPNGSVTQFYYEASFGQFIVQVDVYGPYSSNRSRQDRCYYGGIGETAGSDTDPVGAQTGVGGGGALGMALEVVPQANADVPDWSVYDNDNDGRVDFTMIIHSGGDMAATGNPCFTWSHALQATLGQGEVAESEFGLPHGSLAHSGIATSTPGTFVDRVLTIPEFASAIDPLTIGVASHEMAHSLGEPDYYDTSYNSVGTGDFDIMSGGSYLGNPAGSNPTMMNPATRVFQGWLTPTIVHGDLRKYTLQPRTALPTPGYHVGMADPNLLLVPTYEIAQGETDSLGHTWTADDVYGLAKDPATGKFVVEGYYVENVSRHATSPSLSPNNPMGSMFDRKQHGSGLAVWHFDYWRQSTTYFAHGNDAQNDPNRYQMDLEEFDRNDNTQELQLNYSRGNPGDYLIGAATGITSGTRKLPPHLPAASGDPQKPIDISGVTTAVTEGTAQFTVDNNPSNLEMTVRIADDLAGDCKLKITDPNGSSTGPVDSGGPGGAESITVKKPAAGTWTATVSDFAGCTNWSGRVTFTGPTSSFPTSGAADTWSNWSKAPTGWAFTNVSGAGNGIDSTNEAGGTDAVTLDVLNLSQAKDVSPGFITGRSNAVEGTSGINVGKKAKLQVPVFSNGGVAPGKVLVTVKEAGKHGKVVAKKKVKLPAYGRALVNFRYKATQEGPFRLITTVDPKKKVKEGDERNQKQVSTLWAGPKHPKVLIVDDDQVLAHEQAIAGGLAALGIRYTITAGHVSAAEMSKYAAVVWETAVDRYEGQLDKYDRAELRTYLNGGGKLLLTSNRIFDAMGVTKSSSTPQSTDEGVQFGAQYLGSRIPQGNTTYVVTQENLSTVTRSGFLGKKAMQINPAAARPFVGLAGLAQAGPGQLGTTIQPFGTARGIASLDAASRLAVQPEKDPAYIGVAVDGDSAHHNFKTVTLGWNLGDDVNAKDTVKVLKGVMKHFGVKRHTYRVHSKQPVIYHNAVRDQVSGRATTITAIVLGGPKGGKQKVKLYYRRHGLGKFYKVKMKRKGPGVYYAVIPGAAFTPEGVDYYIRAGRTIDPFGSSKKPLYHGVGVSLPTISNPLPVKK